MEPTLAELRTKYIHAVFTAKRLLDMADEAKAFGVHGGTPEDPSAHDCLVAAAEQYTRRFKTIREECMKLFPDEAVRALAFSSADSPYTAPEEPKA